MDAKGHQAFARHQAVLGHASPEEPVQARGSFDVSDFKFLEERLNGDMEGGAPLLVPLVSVHASVSFSHRVGQHLGTCPWRVSCSSVSSAAILPPYCGRAVGCALARCT